MLKFKKSGAFYKLSLKYPEAEVRDFERNQSVTQLVRSHLEGTNYIHVWDKTEPLLASLKETESRFLAWREAKNNKTLSVAEKTRIAAFATSIGVKGDLSKVYAVFQEVKPVKVLEAGKLYVHVKNPAKVYVAVDDGAKGVTLRSLDRGGKVSSLPKDALQKGIIVEKV